EKAVAASDFEHALRSAGVDTGRERADEFACRQQVEGAARIQLADPEEFAFGQPPKRGVQGSRRRNPPPARARPKETTDGLVRTHAPRLVRPGAWLQPPARKRQFGSMSGDDSARLAGWLEEMMARGTAKAVAPIAADSPAGEGGSDG